MWLLDLWHHPCSQCWGCSLLLCAGECCRVSRGSKAMPLREALSKMQTRACRHILLCQEAFKCLPGLKVEFCTCSSAGKPKSGCFPIQASLLSIICAECPMGHSSRGTNRRSKGRDGWQKPPLPFPQQGGKRTQLVSILSLGRCEPAHPGCVRRAAGCAESTRASPCTGRFDRGCQDNRGLQLAGRVSASCKPHGGLSNFSKLGFVLLTRKGSFVLKTCRLG